MRLEYEQTRQKNQCQENCYQHRYNKIVQDNGRFLINGGKVYLLKAFETPG